MQGVPHDNSSFETGAEEIREACGEEGRKGISQHLRFRSCGSSRLSHVASMFVVTAGWVVRGFKSRYSRL